MKRFLQGTMLWVVLAAGLGSAFGQPAIADPLPDRVTFHYIPDNEGQIMLTVLFDGTTHATLMVDTGTIDSALTDDLVSRLGLTSQPAVTANGRPVTLDSQPLQAVTVPMLKIGPLQFSNSQYTVLSAETVTKGSNVPFDGLLGFNAVHRMPMLINFQTRQITFFYHSPVTAAQLASVGMADAIAVPMNDDKMPGIPPAVMKLTNGARQVTEPMLLDTGSYPTILSEKSALQLKLPTVGSKTMTFPGGPVPTVLTMLPRLSFGPTSTDLPNLTLLYLHGLGLPSVPPHVGLDVMSRYQLLVDFSAKMLYLKPLPDAPVSSDSQ